MGFNSGFKGLIYYRLYSFPFACVVCFTKPILRRNHQRAVVDKGKDHVRTHLVVALVILFIAFVLLKYGPSFKYISSHRGRGQTLKNNNTTILNFLLQ